MSTSKCLNMYSMSPVELDFTNYHNTDKKHPQTRMHSSRMRTGRALTVSGGGCIPEGFFWGKEIEKKMKKKIWRNPPENLRHPPENLRPPRKFETPPKNFRPPGTRPGTPPVDRHMHVNLLPWPNFVAAGNNTCA